MERKNEYHNLVSPIVLNGGRCRFIHNPAMKMKKMNEPMAVVAMAVFLWLRKDSIVPTAQNVVAAVAYMWNVSQVMVVFCFFSLGGLLAV